MDGWTDGMDAWMDGWMLGWMWEAVVVEGPSHMEWRIIWMGGCMHRWVGGQLDGERVWREGVDGGRLRMDG